MLVNALSFVGLLFLSLSASAALVTTDFTGTVTEHNPIVGGPAIGSSISGSFTIETSDTTGVGVNCVGTPYCWSDASTTWTWNGTTVTGPTSSSHFGVYLTVQNRPPGFGADILTVAFGDGRGTTRVLTLRDSTGKAFEKADIPFLPSLSGFNSASLSFIPICVTTISCATNPYYSGDLTSFSSAPSAVPIPAAAWLFGSALLGLVGIKRKFRS